MASKSHKEIFLSEIQRQKQLRSTKLFQWFFIGVAALLGSSFSHVALNDLRSSQWPAVEGRVESSAVAYDSSPDGNSYSPVVEYSYSVDGRPYRARRLKYVQMAGGSSSAYRKVKEYPAGKIVPVYYNPKKPSESVLEPGADGWALSIGGVVLSVFIGIFLWLAYLCHRYDRKLSDALLTENGYRVSSS